MWKSLFGMPGPSAGCTVGEVSEELAYVSLAPMYVSEMSNVPPMPVGQVAVLEMAAHLPLDQREVHRREANRFPDICMTWNSSWIRATAVGIKVLRRKFSVGEAREQAVSISGGTQASQRWRWPL